MPGQQVIIIIKSTQTLTLYSMKLCVCIEMLSCTFCDYHMKKQPKIRFMPIIDTVVTPLSYSTFLQEVLVTVVLQVPQEVQVPQEQRETEVLQVMEVLTDLLDHLDQLVPKVILEPEELMYVFKWSGLLLHGSWF